MLKWFIQLTKDATNEAAKETDTTAYPAEFSVYKPYFSSNDG